MKLIKRRKEMFIATGCDIYRASFDRMRPHVHDNNHAGFVKSIVVRRIEGQILVDASADGDEWAPHCRIDNADEEIAVNPHPVARYLRFSTIGGCAEVNLVVQSHG